MSWEDDQKALHGKFATVIWIAGSVLLFLVDDESPGLLSWQSAVFVLGGMFVAAIVVGNITYYLQRRVAQTIIARYDNSAEGLAAQAGAAKKMSYALFVFDSVISAAFLLWIYNSFFWN